MFISILDYIISVYTINNRLYESGVISMWLFHYTRHSTGDRGEHDHLGSIAISNQHQYIFYDGLLLGRLGRPIRHINKIESIFD